MCNVLFCFFVVQCVVIVIAFQSKTYTSMFLGKQDEQTPPQTKPNLTHPDGTICLLPRGRLRDTMACILADGWGWLDLPPPPPPRFFCVFSVRALYVFSFSVFFGLRFLAGEGLIVVGFSCRPFPSSRPRVPQSHKAGMV